MFGSRTPTEEEKKTSAEYRAKRKAHFISLNLMSKLTGYSFNYLVQIECGVAPASIGFVKEYDRVIEYIENGCQTNPDKRKRKKLKKSIDIKTE